jgi:hypothetical protein
MARYHRGPECPACESQNCRPAHRRNLWERFLGLIGIRPFRCRDCRARFWQFRSLVSILPFLA